MFIIRSHTSTVVVSSVALAVHAAQFTYQERRSSNVSRTGKQSKRTRNKQCGNHLRRTPLPRRTISGTERTPLSLSLYNTSYDLVQDISQYKSTSLLTERSHCCPLYTRGRNVRHMRVTVRGLAADRQRACSRDLTRPSMPSIRRSASAASLEQPSSVATSAATKWNCRTRTRQRFTKIRKRTNVLVYGYVRTGSLSTTLDTKNASTKLEYPAKLSTSTTSASAFFTILSIYGIDR